MAISVNPKNKQNVTWKLNKLKIWLKKVVADNPGQNILEQINRYISDTPSKLL